MVLLPLATLTALAASVAAFPAKRWDRPVVDLGYATYQGVYNETTNIQYFRGMRYAAPPTGDLRWKAPQPPAAVTGVQDASMFGAQCIQGTVGGTPIKGLLNSKTAQFPGHSEDCLFVNVYLPPNATVQGSLPVAVYIHGGGYTMGSGDSTTPENLYAQAKGNYVFVSINYRLAQFGFLGGNEVAAAGGLNAGLLDQQFALRWVQDNIAKFGGDPSHVTLWGESAGAGSIYQQIIANGGNTQPPLFNAAILASPFEPPIFAYNASKPQQAYDDLVAAGNCTGSADTLACLRTVDAKLLALAGSFNTAEQINGDFLYTPVIDGTFIQDRPEKLLAEGKVNGERVWATHNYNEGLIVNGGSFTPQDIGNNATLQREYISGFYTRLDNASVDEIQAAYTADAFGSLQLATDFLYAEGVFGCEALWVSEAFSGNSYLGWLVIPAYSAHASDLTLSFTANTLAGTPYAPIAAQWTQNINSFISYYSLEQDYAPMTFMSDSPQQVVVNVTESLGPDISYDAVPANFVTRCNLWRSLAPTIPL